jgi:hypothetical protein
MAMALLSAYNSLIWTARKLTGIKVICKLAVLELYFSVTCMLCCLGDFLDSREIVVVLLIIFQFNMPIHGTFN